MTAWQLLVSAGLLIACIAVYLSLRILLEMRKRIVVTVARPTTTDGETVQLTGNLHATADSKAVSDLIETFSLGIQRRLAFQNELVAKTNADIAHEKWKKIRQKLDDAEAEGRRGTGVLGRDERVWWQRHHDDFDANGPTAKVTETRIAEAAVGPEPSE